MVVVELGVGPSLRRAGGREGRREPAGRRRRRARRPPGTRSRVSRTLGASMPMQPIGAPPGPKTGAEMQRVWVSFSSSSNA